MKRISLSIFLAVLLLIQLQISVWGGQNADITGRVLDSQGNPVSGVEILAADANGQTHNRSLTNEQGEYAVTGLEKGQYRLTLNPRASGLKGQTVMAALDQRGLVVAWTASATAPAIATASTPRSSSPQPASSSVTVADLTGGPTIASSVTKTVSPASLVAPFPMQAVTAATVAGDTAGAVANSGQSEDSSNRRRGYFLGGLGLLGAGLGGAAASGAFDDDNDHNPTVSPTR
jgi:hypothetical protein